MKKFATFIVLSVLLHAIGATQAFSADAGTNSCGYTETFAQPPYIYGFKEKGDRFEGNTHWEERETWNISNRQVCLEIQEKEI